MPKPKTLICTLNFHGGRDMASIRPRNHTAGRFIKRITTFSWWNPSRARDWGQVAESVRVGETRGVEYLSIPHKREHFPHTGCPNEPPSCRKIGRNSMRSTTDAYRSCLIFDPAQYPRIFIFGGYCVQADRFDPPLIIP